MTTDEHFEIIEEKLGQLLMALTSFSKSQKNEVQDFIDAGEYGLAVETGFQIVLEENKHISEQAFGLFRELVEAMEVQESVDISQLSQHVSRNRKLDER